MEAAICLFLHMAQVDITFCKAHIVAIGAKHCGDWGETFAEHSPDL